MKERGNREVYKRVEGGRVQGVKSDICTYIQQDQGEIEIETSGTTMVVG